MCQIFEVEPVLRIVVNSVLCVKWLLLWAYRNQTATLSEVPKTKHNQSELITFVNEAVKQASDRKNLSVVPSFYVCVQQVSGTNNKRSSQAELSYGEESCGWLPVC
jgi:hypothetical protein